MDVNIFTTPPEVVYDPQPWMTIRVFKDRVFGVVLNELWVDEEAGRPDTQMFHLAAIDAMYAKVLEHFFSPKAGIAPNLGGELDIPIYNFMTNTRYGQSLGASHFASSSANAFGVEVVLKDNEVHRHFYHLCAQEQDNGYKLRSVGVLVDEVATMPAWPLAQYRINCLFEKAKRKLEAIPAEQLTPELKNALKAVNSALAAPK